MLLQYPAVHLPLILLYINICVGQIVFDRRPPSVSRCISPNGERGTCELWTKCESLHQTIYDWDEMKRYLCGFAGDEPRVCCPSTSRPDTSDRPPSTTTGTRRDGGSYTPAPGPPRFPNDKPPFLPDDCGSSIFTHNRVIGGQKAEKGSWPWMAMLFRVKGRSKVPECGGALVTARHVVTAAHCVVNRLTFRPMEPSRFLVRVGLHNVSDDTDPDIMDVGVDEVRVHKDYDYRRRTNDIAVLRLRQNVPFSNSTAPVCLPYDSLWDEDLTGKSATVTGFGMTDANDKSSTSDVLIEVNFDIQDNEVCREAYKRDLAITDVHLCAGTMDGSKDSCQGDSGGPLVTVGKEKRFYLIGVVSFGKNKCALRGYPGVYTRITEYLDWLEVNLAD